MGRTRRSARPAKRVMRRSGKGGVTSSSDEHKFEYIATPLCALVKEQRSMTMHDATVYCRRIATRTAQEVRHYTYDSDTKLWVLRHVFHADGTATDSTGVLRRWKGAPGQLWEPADQGEQQQEQ